MASFVEQALALRAASSQGQGPPLPGASGGPSGGGGSFVEQALKLRQQQQAPPTAPAGPAPATAPPVAPPVAEADVNPADLPEIRTGARSDLDFVPSIMATAKRLVLSEPEDLAKGLGSIEGINIKRNRKGEPFAEIKGKRYALNKPGKSLQDFVPFATALVTNVGLDAILGPLGPAAAAGISGGFTGLALAGGEAAAKGETPDLKTLGISAGVGAGSGLLGSVLVGKFGELLKRSGTLLDSSGNLTRTAREAIKQQGLDADNISRATLQEADKLLKGRKADPDSIRRAVAEADTAATGIPLTKGQTTGNLKQLGLEVAGQQNIRGPEAAGAFKTFAQQQQEALGQAAENAAQKVAPRATLGGNESATGEAVASALRASEQQARGRVSAAYDTFKTIARQSNLALPTTPSGGALLPRVQQALVQDFPDINDAIAPQAAAALRRFENLSKNQFTTAEGLAGERKAITNAIRNTRKTNPTDSGALSRILRVYDDFTTDAVQTAAGGSPQGTAILKSFSDARKTAADRFSRFTKGEKDVAGGVIEDILDGSINAEQITNRLLGGQNQFTSQGAEVFARLRRALGSNDAVIDDIKRTAILRIIGGSADQQALEARGAQAVANSIKKALDGQGGRYANMILGGKGVDQLRILERQIRRQIRPGTLANPSGSGFTGRKAVRDGIRALIYGGGGAALGAAAGSVVPGVGNAVGAVAGGAIGKAVGDAAASKAGLRLAQQAIKPFGLSTSAQATAKQLGALPGKFLLEGLPPAAVTGTLGILNTPER